MGEEFKCSKCEKAFKSNIDLSRHKLHMHQKFVMCTRCEKMFSGYQKLRDHLKDEHSSFHAVDDLWLCPKCDERWKSTQELNEHLHQEHSVPKDHFCSKCDDALASKPLLANHLYETHGLDPMKETEDDSASTMLNPKKIVKDPKARQFKCEECSVYLASSRTL